MSDNPKTIPEQLDAARSGKEFAQVLNNLIGALERAKDEADVLKTSKHHHEKQESAMPESESLRTRIAAALYGQLFWISTPFEDQPDDVKDMWLFQADIVIRELGEIPDRIHFDDQGRRWEWCGGVPGTWAWRITRLDNR